MALLIKPPAAAVAAHRVPEPPAEPVAVDDADLRWICALLAEPDSCHLLLLNHAEKFKLICEDLTHREVDEYPKWSAMQQAAIAAYGLLYPEEGPVVCFNCRSELAPPTWGARLVRACQRCKGVIRDVSCWAADHYTRGVVARAMFIPDAKFEFFLAKAIHRREELKDGW